jgi:flagellar basal body-associated protein FliL
MKIFPKYKDQKFIFAIILGVVIACYHVSYFFYFFNAKNKRKKNTKNPKTMCKE